MQKTFNFPIFALSLALLYASCDKPVIDPIVACFTADKTECELGDCLIQFNAGCSQNAVYYKWDFDGDGRVDEEGADKKNVQQTYDSAGSFEVKLIIENEESISSFVTKQITVTTSASPCELKLYLGHNQSGFLNEPLPEKVQVRLLDTQEEGIQGFQVNFAVLTGGGAITQADITDGEGVAEASWTLGNTCGEQRVKAWVENENCEAEILEISGFGDEISYEEEDYPVVEIGGQCWLAKNLNAGNFISVANAQTQNGNIEKYGFSDTESSCDTYGGLYNWQEVMDYASVENSRGICPIGWHIPSKNDWEALINHLGGEDVAGGKLKSTSQLWEPPNTGATNESGFSALPGGYYFDCTPICFPWGFPDIPRKGNFWSSSLEGDSPIYLYLNNDNTQARLETSSTALSFSCRCIQD